MRPTFPPRPPSASSTALVRPALWSLTSKEVTTIDCPTCGARKHALCRTLRDRPTTALHRGRKTRYLNLRFGLDLTEPHTRHPQPHRAPTGPGIGLHATRTPDPQPWRLPLYELADLINISFLDHAKVVTAHACGLRRTGLDGLLYGPDHIQQSLDALTYALHDRQLQRETHALTRGRDAHTTLLAEQQQAIRSRLLEAEQLLKRRRITELTAAGILPFPPRSDDPRHVARAWLGRYLADEKEALVHAIATAAGVPHNAAAPIRSIRDKITKSIDNGWITAPVNDTVEQLLATDDHAFRRRLIADATQQDARDDALCHPLVLNRWRDQLNHSLTDLAPAAENPTTKRLHDLTPTGRARSASQIEQLAGRRRLFAALLQRRAECTRLITDLNDTMTLAEQADPSYTKLKQAADQAYSELVRQHPDLYQRIRSALTPTRPATAASPTTHPAPNSGSGFSPTGTVNRSV
ncbi:hypothetical protein KV205_19305 [Streptomyces sp. SKN60]|uniref:hypothetical protein n=1 Tax=Streptomyces sp. SKN60 TaxID=2855506 RepID=UPI0022486DA0|nr:hypothetical protein [Streptomyces sp. SKN60]MCX2182660.1 hypothetical protein [Streptomyces sp. SKN60]